MKAHMKILLGAAALLFAAGLFALPAAEAEAETASELFLPSGYEQYLPLDDPKDAAMNGSYIVVADGSCLYVYHRTENRWLRYLHAPFGEPRSITKVQFTDDGRLFFSDQDAQLYNYLFDKQSAVIQTNISCSTFVIDGDTLYTTAVANGRTTFLAFPHRGSGLSYDRRVTIGDLSTPTSIAPHMFVQDGVLYCAINSYVHAYRPTGGQYEHLEFLLAGGSPVQDLTSVAVFGDKIYYTVNGAAPSEQDGLYVVPRTFDGAPRRLLAESGFNALMTYDGRLFCVKGTSVRELETDGETARYTGYEIAAESDSRNRLSGATDTVRARDLLVTADVGNGRVSVYNMRTEQYDVIPCGEATCVATDGSVIAVGAGNEVRLYRYDENEPFFDEERAKTEADYQPREPYYVHHSADAVVGVAVVYGKCYYVTTHYYGLAEENAQEFTRNNSPVALTSDVYGNLYVADMSARVLRYTEEEFLDRALGEGAEVNETWTLPAQFRSLRADFDGNLYYISENALYGNGERLATLDGSGYVYRGTRTEPVELASVALGFEDSGLYLQYGSFVVLARNVRFPSLSEIAAGNAGAEVFRAPAAEELSLTDVPAGATGIGVDAGKLTPASEYFPYTDYARTQLGGRGVVLAERGKFNLVALFEKFYYGERDYEYLYEYTVSLYRKEDCTDAPVAVLTLSPQTRYLSSEVALSYYPCLSEPLSVERLPRAQEVTLLATVTAEDGKGFDFAYVEADGKYGYVPLSYLTESAPVSPPADEYTLGYLKASDEGVRFLAEDGSASLLVKERTQVEIYEAHDGLYRIRFRRDGRIYTAQVTEDMLQRGNPDALRTGLIIVLCVVAVGIIVAYILFLPRGKKKKAP